MTEGLKMTPAHPGWREFRYLLAEACHFEFGDPDQPEAMTWECDCTTDRATTVLAEHFTDCDIKGSVSYWERRGGQCSCEVLFNVRGDDE